MMTDTVSIQQAPDIYRHHRRYGRHGKLRAAGRATDDDDFRQLDMTPSAEIAHQYFVRADAYFRAIFVGTGRHHRKRRKRCRQSSRHHCGVWG